MSGKMAGKVVHCLPDINHAECTKSAMGTGLSEKLYTLALSAFAFIVVALGGAAPAVAQTLHTFVNGTNGTINGSTTCAAPLVRNFSVAQSFAVSDVDIGVYATHSWRGDIRLTLQAPDGTRIQLVDGDINNTNGDNFNVRLDDSGSQVVNTDSATGNHSTTAPPPFANQFIPDNLLSGFNGLGSQGTWRLEICDLFPNADDGVFRHAELYLTQPPTNFADLSLTKTVSNNSPAPNSNVTFTLSVTNSATSTQTATATILDQLSAGFQFVSFSGDGTYNSVTGIWTPSTIAPGQTRVLNIVAQVITGSGTPLTNVAEIQTSNRFDTDSTPGNGNAAEDDYATASLTTSGTRTAGIPPSLTCPDGTIAFSWAGRSWPAGSTANNYTLTGLGAFNWSLVSPAGWMNIPSLGGIHPRLTTAAQGITTLSKAIDFDNRDQISTTTVTFGNVVDGAQFRIIDVDYAFQDFADKITVTGYLNGTPVIPVLTNGVANYVIGNSAFGDNGSSAASTDGDVYATFNQSVDTVVIEYGNHSLAPNDPDGQAIQMDGAITLCSPNAEISVTKISSILDDLVTGPAEEFHLPGATLSYCILITNLGSGTAEDFAAIDTLPANTTYVAGTMKSGAGCDTAATVEDDDASDGSEIDGTIASFAGGTITVNIDEITGSSAKALTFTASIN